MDTINYFYRNNCFEFRMIKQRILQYRFPSDKQLVEWKEKHFLSYSWVMTEINDLAKDFLDDSNCESPQYFLECNGFSFIDYLTNQISPLHSKKYCGFKWTKYGDEWFHKYNMYNEAPRSIIGFECSWQISYWDEHEEIYRVNKDVLDKICPP